MNNKYLSRKFISFNLGILIITAGLFTKFLTGGEFITAFVLLFGTYAGSNVWETKAN